MAYPTAGYAVGEDADADFKILWFVTNNGRERGASYLK
jgi:hypothetical protein